MRDEHLKFLEEMASQERLESLVRQKEIEIELGLKLYDLRTAAGLTQQEVADLAKVQQAQISRWESDGIPASTQMETLMRVFGALKATVSLTFSQGEARTQVTQDVMGDLKELTSVRKAISKAAQGKQCSISIRDTGGQKMTIMFEPPQQSKKTSSRSSVKARIRTASG